MTKATAKLTAKGHAQLENFGARIKAARLRRNLPQALVAERAGVSIMTYRSAEAGSPGCALGTYMAILEVLGLSADLDLLAKEDSLGRNLQDSSLNVRASTVANKIRARIDKSFWPVADANRSSRLEKQGENSSHQVPVDTSSRLAGISPKIGFVKVSATQTRPYKEQRRKKVRSTLSDTAAVEIKSNSLRPDTKAGDVVALDDLVSLLVKPKSKKG